MNANNVPPVTDELGKVDSSADAIKKPVEDANVSKSVIIGEEERKSVVEDDVMIKVETGKMTEKPISGYSGLKELNNVSDRPKLVSSFSRRASISTSTLQSTSTPHQEQHQQQQLQLQQVPVKAQAKTKKQKAEKGEGIGTILSMSPTHLISVAARIRRQSARWLALSATFWYLVIMDSSRVTTTESVEKLFEVLKWRATGKITSDEFSAIMTEWKRETVMELEEFVMPSPRNQTFSLFHMRLLLCDIGYKENDIDLFVGIVVHEANNGLQNTPISFEPSGNKPGKVKKSRRGGSRDSRNMTGTGKLESISQRWLSLSEELFFVLDNSGYGSLRYDEIFFLSACLSCGLRGWVSQEELEGDLSLSTISAYATELMKEMGCILGLTALNQEKASGTVSHWKGDGR